MTSMSPLAADAQHEVLHLDGRAVLGQQMHLQAITVTLPIASHHGQITYTAENAVAAQTLTMPLHVA